MDPLFAGAVFHFSRPMPGGRFTLPSGRLPRRSVVFATFHTEFHLALRTPMLVRVNSSFGLYRIDFHGKNAPAHPRKALLHHR